MKLFVPLTSSSNAEPLSVVLQSSFILIALSTLPCSDDAASPFVVAKFVASGLLTKPFRFKFCGKVTLKLIKNKI